MHTPKYFQPSALELKQFILQQGFGMLVSNTDNGLTSTALPFVWDDTGLHMHIARANPHWNHLDNAKVLFNVMGPHYYISPTLYQDGGVPTWNYQAAEITGRTTVFTDTKQLEQLVNKHAAIYEKKYGTGWQPDYNPKMLTAIIGIHLHIESIAGQFKLSQNRTDDDQASVKSWLEKQGAGDLARTMKGQN